MTINRMPVKRGAGYHLKVSEESILFIGRGRLVIGHHDLWGIF
jgi:hypothetical protein